MGLIYNASITTIEKKKIELTTKIWGLIIKKKKKKDILDSLFVGN